MADEAKDTKTLALERAQAHAEKMATYPHLYHTKDAFKAALKNAMPHEHPALAALHGWHILDIVCACGNKVPDHVVDTRSTIADDLRVKPCLKCGARGAWTATKAVKPPSPLPVQAPEVVPPVTVVPAA